jgi:hypothetical protein
MKNLGSKTLVASAIMLLSLSADIAAQAGGNWPQWRGPNRDGISTETGLLKQWPADGPPLAWKISGAGTGYSSLAKLIRWVCAATVNMSSPLTWQLESKRGRPRTAGPIEMIAGTARVELQLLTAIRSTLWAATATSPLWMRALAEPFGQ